jgi:hypothetical protein
MVVLGDMNARVETWKWKEGVGNLEDIFHHTTVSRKFPGGQTLAPHGSG